MIDLIMILALLHMNHTDDENVFPFPVEKTGVTFCFQLAKKVDGVIQHYTECNWVDMPKKKLERLRDHLENWTSQK